MSELSQASQQSSHYPLPAGRVVVAPRAIAALAAYAASQQPGVVGLAPQTLYTGVAQPFCREEAYRGVAVRLREAISLDVYVILEYGAPIAEVAQHVQERVRAALEQALGWPVEQVNVRVQGLRAST